jgi:hypothetical protein
MPVRYILVNANSACFFFCSSFIKCNCTRCVHLVQRLWIFHTLIRHWGRISTTRLHPYWKCKKSSSLWYDGTGLQCHLSTL